MRDQDSVAVLELAAKWRQRAEVLRGMKGGRNYRVRGAGVVAAAHIDDCAAELEALQSQQDGAQGGDAMVTVCLVSDVYASGNIIEAQLQVEPGTTLPIGTKLYAAPQATPAAVDGAMVDAGLRGWFGEHYDALPDRDAYGPCMRAALTAALAAPPAEVKP